MKTILLEFYSPEVVGCEFETETVQKQTCFDTLHYASETAAFHAYNNSHALWSTLLDDDSDDSDIQAFIDEAYERIKDNDIEWLERNFF